MKSNQFILSHLFFFAFFCVILENNNQNRSLFRCDVTHEARGIHSFSKFIQFVIINIKIYKLPDEDYSDKP